MPAERHTPQHARYDELVKREDDDDDDGASPKKQAARRRAYAKRSCLKCREKKARCELPEQSLTVPSSMTPLSGDYACHRCKVLSLDCVVWDGNRKRRPKVSAASSAAIDDDSYVQTTRIEASSSRLSPFSARSPGSLEQLAAAAARLSDHRNAFNNAAKSSPHPAASSSTDTDSSKEAAASTLASVQFFNTVMDHPAASPSSMPSSDRNRLSSDKGGINTRSPADLQARTPSRMPSPHPTASPGKVDPPGRTWTSLWRPLSVLIDYAAQQPSFTSYLLARIDPQHKNLDILDLIPLHTLSHLKPFLKPYLLWHPHLPGLDIIYAEHCKRPTVSSALLLSSMCLVACRHAMPLTDALPIKLSTLVDQLGTQILLSAPRDMYTVQALELLLSHDPSLVGTSVAGAAQAERGNGLLGESLLAAALTIAKGLDLDKSIDHVVDLCAGPAPDTESQGTKRRDSLAKHMAGASIWLSLRIWEGHFSFVNSTVRPIDLSDIMSKADVMVAIDSNGHKIERMHRDPFQSTEKRFPGLDEDTILRSAGRTGLVYRLKTMGRFQDTIAGMYRILASVAKPEQPTASISTKTTEKTREETLKLLTDSSNNQQFWLAAKQQAFSPFATVRPALLLEDWATMESYSLQSLLPCLAVCAFMTGELNRGFSASEMVNLLKTDISLRNAAAVLGQMRDAQSHNMLATFHVFDRGLGYSQPDIFSIGRSRVKNQRNALWIEATGAPLLLTTAIVSDGCKTFLEKTACALYGFDMFEDTGDMHTVFMINSLRRLEECDRNFYLPPIRSKRDSMPPPFRRPSAVSSDVSDDKDDIMHGRSITQIGVLFVEDMVQSMQKWKLGASLQRSIPYHFRHIFGNTEDAVEEHKIPSQSEYIYNAAKNSNLPERTSLDSATQSGESSFNTSAPTFKDADRGANISQAQSFSQGLQTNFVAGLPQQSHPTVTESGNGGIFGLPMFDLLGSASTSEWTNNVPWFDPIENGMSATASLSNLVTGQNPTETHQQWYQYQNPSQSNSSAWPALQRQRNGETLPSMQFNAPQPAQGLQPSLSTPGQPHGYSQSHSGHTYANGYADQAQSYSASNGSQHQSPQQHHPQYQQQQHHRSYYGANHHGGR